MTKLFPSLTLLLLLALFVGIGRWLHVGIYYPHVVVIAPDKLTVTFLQRGSDEGESCAASVATIASLMSANCPMCVVTEQQCLRELTPDMRKLLSEAPIATPSAQMRYGVITFAHPNPQTALATCLETQKQSTSRNPPQGHVVCYPANMPRQISQSQSPTAIRAVLRNLGQGIIVLGAGISLLLLIQLLAVRSPTDFDGTISPIQTYAKPSNFAKRFLDVTISILLLIILFPILIIVSALILIVEGYPIFYVSKRFISADRSVSIYKFRTMARDANSPKYRLRERFMREGYLDIPLDCEVYTALGRILERTQLVEVLQLSNVIVHGMSLVGNRPLPKDNIDLLKQFGGWEGRFDSPAGITGISQIVGKLTLEPKDRIELECLYSSLYKSKTGNILYCDMLILFYTAQILLFGTPISLERARQLIARARGSSLT